MWQDPVVQETRELRKMYAEQFKYDPDAIFEDILSRQEKTSRKQVTFPARKPEAKPNISS